MLRTELIMAMEVWSMIPIVALGLIIVGFCVPYTRDATRVACRKKAAKLIIVTAWLVQGSMWLLAAKSIYRDVFHISFHESTLEWRRSAEPLWIEVGVYAMVSLICLFAIDLIAEFQRKRI
jgi:hypothetical protein